MLQQLHETKYSACNWLKTAVTGLTTLVKGNGMQKNKQTLIMSVIIIIIIIIYTFLSRHKVVTSEAVK